MHPKLVLMREYARKFNYTIRCLEICGFSRFIIRNSKIENRNFWTRIYNICLIFVVNGAAVFLLGFADITRYMTSAEVLTIIEFSAYSNLLLFHNTFAKQRRGAEIMRHCIEIDSFFGVEETKKIRNAEIKLYIGAFIGVWMIQLTTVSVMWYLFDVSMAIHIVGTLYFIWLFIPVDDLCLLAYWCIFSARRARVLNVALAKITGMNMEYIPMHNIFYKLFWNAKYDASVTFHMRGNNGDFTTAFNMLFKQIRLLENSYEFTLIVGVATIVVNTFVTVQTYILYIKTSTSITRATAITGFTIISWLYIIMMSIMINTFYSQIQQTKLICSYIQLKPTCTAESLKLTKIILRTFEIRDARFSCLGVSSFTTGLMMQIIASTFVYITVQLQLAFPDRHKVDNDAENMPKLVLDSTSARNYLFF